MDWDHVAKPKYWTIQTTRCVLQYVWKIRIIQNYNNVYRNISPGFWGFFLGGFSETGFGIQSKNHFLKSLTRASRGGASSLPGGPLCKENSRFVLQLHLEAFSTQYTQTCSTQYPSNFSGDLIPHVEQVEGAGFENTLLKTAMSQIRQSLATLFTFVFVFLLMQMSFSWTFFNKVCDNGVVWF